MVPSAGNTHTRPIAIQVIDIAPHIEGKNIPASLVVNIYAETIVCGFGLLATTPVVALPALAPDISEGAKTRVVCMGSLLTGCSEFLALIL